MEDAGLRKRRYWFRSRRGMKEVEVVLQDYFNRFYDQDSEEQQLMFGRLLECNDVDMFDWFIRSGTPDDVELAEYVSQLLKRVASR